MAIRSVKNQYRGINAHLHSYWQAEGGWDSFHTLHIGDLTKMLDAALLPMGYTADVEKSLQIRRRDEPIGEPESDVTIYDLDSIRAQQAALSTRQTGLKLLDVMDVEEDTADYAAIGIYKFRPQKPKQGKPVAWLELLSPSNKIGQDSFDFRHKRQNLLKSGIVYLELDYLHETPPTFNRIPDYSRAVKQQTSIEVHPYRIVVIDPRPNWFEASVYPYLFDADAPLPVVDIPLSGKDVLSFDFGLPYQRTFEDMRYGLKAVDYSQLPLNFDGYSQADQLRIVTRLLTVIEAQQQGQDLEQAPLPLLEAPASLEDALARFNALAGQL